MNKKIKLIAIIVIIAVVLASAFAVYSNIKDKSDASGIKGETVQTSSEKETKADAKEENKGDGSSKDSNDKEKSDADKSKEDTDSKEAGEKVDSEATSTSKPNNNTSSGSSSSNSSSNTSKPNKPAHTHNWQPVYETVTKYRTAIVTKYVCNGKYFDDYDSGYEYFEWCCDNAIGASLHPEDVKVQVSYEDEVLVGYKCSCGATKSS